MICASFLLIELLSICGTVCLMIDVVHEEYTNTFKSRLDKFWSNREIIYDIVPKFKELGVNV